MRDSVPPRHRADAGGGAGWRGRGVLALVPITRRGAGGGAGGRGRGVLALVPITLLAGTWPAGSSGGPLPGTGGAGAVRQLVTVTARSHTATYATLRAYWVLGGRRVPVFGPWTARVGYNGVALPGAKREGDGKTPSGTFGISFFFGVQRKLDFSFPFRHAYSFDYWDDDPASPRYNEWVNANRHDPGVDPEPMRHVPAYDYAAVIAYNTARTPGLGSAIFLHVGFSSPTVGCVSLPRPRLITILLWLNPQDHPKIAISG